MSVRAIVRSALATIPWVRSLFYRYRVYGPAPDEKTIRGRLQQIGHSIDLRMRSGTKVPQATITEFEFLLKQASRKGLAIDEAMAWAVKMFTAAQHGLTVLSEEDTASSASPETDSSANDVSLSEAILRRRSIRSWTGEDLDLQDVRRIVELARWAPSSCNRQLWQVMLLHAPKDIEFISRYFASSFCRKAPLLMLVLMNVKLYGYHEKHFAYLDGGAFIQNLLLILHARGYGACWLGFKGWDASGKVFVAAEEHDRFYDYLKLDKTQIPISMIAVGRPVAIPQPPPRQDVSSIILEPSQSPC